MRPHTASPCSWSHEVFGRGAGRLPPVRRAGSSDARAWRISGATASSDRSAATKAQSTRARRVNADRRAWNARDSALYRPWIVRAATIRAFPSAVLAPVLPPPCMRHRPFFIAGPRHGQPRRVRAPQRGAALGLPCRLPFRSRPAERGSPGRMGSPAGCTAGAGGAIGGAEATAPGCMGGLRHTTIIGCRPGSHVPISMPTVR